MESQFPVPRKGRGVVTPEVVVVVAAEAAKVGGHPRPNGAGTGRLAPAGDEPQLRLPR